jgi:4-carboxymuconolactone decarboxylase
MTEPYVTKKRIHQEGLNEDFYVEALEQVQSKVFGSMPLYGGKGDKDAKMEKVGGTKPALGDYDFPSTIWALGTLFGRGHLSLKDRTAIVLAGLTVLPRPELVRLWVNASLNMGWSEDEIREVIIWTSFFGGFPAMRTSGLISADVFAKRQENPDLKMA